MLRSGQKPWKRMQRCKARHVCWQTGWTPRKEGRKGERDREGGGVSDGEGGIRRGAERREKRRLSSTVRIEKEEEAMAREEEKA